MTREEARRIEQSFYNKSNPSKAEVRLYIEAMEFLIKTENLPEDIMRLGGYYYECRQFNQALKYYEQAATFGIDAADECLGYIWYYGRTGVKDYQKAFEYYSKSMERGNITSAYKVADMYKNGYYVDKDYNRYVEIIEGLYTRACEADSLFAPLPEIFTRLARIRKEQECYEEAIELYLVAKDFLAQRISYNAFFGNLNIMKWLIDDLYTLIDFDEEAFDFFDLYYVLKMPNRATFTDGTETYCVESIAEGEGVAVYLDGVRYNDRDEFFAKACNSSGEKLTAVNQYLCEFGLINNSDI